MILPLPANRVRRNYRGGLELDRLVGAACPADGDQPEDWIASTVSARNPGLAAIDGEGLAFVTDPQGRRLLVRDLFERYPDHYLGAAHVAQLGTELGFLAKLLDSSMRLHIQAHPTAAFAQNHLNSRWGKLETYVVLGARPGYDASLWLGFQRAPSPDELRRTVLEQDMAAMHSWFDTVSAEPGSVWVVPGGLPHAIGAGLLVVEVMEPTDLVVRCEFEREGIVVPPEARFMGRDPDFALQVFDLQSQSVDAIRRRCCVQPEHTREGDGFVEAMLIGPAQTDCFTIHRVTVDGSATVSTSHRVQVGIVESGAGSAAVGDQTIPLRRGATFLVAAAAEAVHYRSDADQSLDVLICQPGDFRD